MRRESRGTAALRREYYTRHFLTYPHVPARARGVSHETSATRGECLRGNCFAKIIKKYN